MRTMLYLAPLLTVFLSASARGDEVPDNVPILKLPPTARFVVINKVSGGIKMCSDESDWAIGNNKGDGIFLYSCRSPLTSLKVGDVIPINSVTTEHSSGRTDYVIRYKLSDQTTGAIFLNRYYPNTTIGKLKAFLSGHLSIEYDDPYAGLAPDVLVDLIMKKITTKIKSGDYASAVDDFVRLDNLKDAKLPESFYYYYAETLEKAGNKHEAHARGNDYLKRYGKKGKYYSQVIDIMSRL